MKSLKRTIGLLAAVVSFAAATGARMNTQDRMLCDDLEKFEDTVTRLDHLGPQNTVKDAKYLTDQATNTAKRIENRARTNRNAQDLDRAIQDLNRSVNNLPPDATIGSAQASINDQVRAVKTAADNFQASRCQK